MTSRKCPKCNQALQLEEKNEYGGYDYCVHCGIHYKKIPLQGYCCKCKCPIHTKYLKEVMSLWTGYVGMPICFECAAKHFYEHGGLRLINPLDRYPKKPKKKRGLDRWI